LHEDDPLYAVPTASHPPTVIATPRTDGALCTANGRAKHQCRCMQPSCKKYNWKLQRRCNDVPMLLTIRCTTLTLIPHKQLHPKETRDLAAQNPKSNPTYTIASFESNPTCTIAPKRDERESRGDLRVHRDIDSRSGENETYSAQKNTFAASYCSGENSAPLWKKHCTHGALMHSTHCTLMQHTYAPHSRTALLHHTHVPHWKNSTLTHYTYRTQRLGTSF
jgi:hypothetical protein